jgi:NADH-quinone oxidoreductase subunit N
VFGAAINSGSVVSWGPYLAIAGLLNSALSLAYYVWIIKKMYMEQGPDMSKVNEPRAMSAVLIFAIIFMVGFGVWYSPVLEFASKAVPHFGSIGPIISTGTSSNHLSKPIPVATSQSNNIRPISVAGTNKLT